METGRKENRTSKKEEIEEEEEAIRKLQNENEFARSQMFDVNFLINVSDYLRTRIVILENIIRQMVGLFRPNEFYLYASPCCHKMVENHGDGNWACSCGRNYSFCEIIKKPVSVDSCWD